MNPGQNVSPSTTRLKSIDAYRGLIMVLMMAQVLDLCAVSSALADSGLWRFICHHASHVPWVGCSLHDLIQPGFSFLVGVALPFSLAKRQELGQTALSLWRHTTVRTTLLIFLGIFFNSVHPRVWSWTFEDTLTQIGLGYPLLFWLAFRPDRDVWIVSGLILLLVWLAFALYPLPGPDFNYEQVGVSPAWLEAHGVTGFFAHWQKNSNLAWAFDHWFLNLFPRSSPFTGFENGVATLNFIPLIATMSLGMLAGRVLRRDWTPCVKLRWLCIGGATGLAVGTLLHLARICPVVKLLWTPAWVCFSGGWCLVLLAGFYGFVEVGGRQRMVFPLVVVGMNSIVAYGCSNLFTALAYHSILRVVGEAPFRIFGPVYEPAVYGVVILAGYWLFLYLLYRRKLFLKL